jgi:20S proteasome alpha/beta subunit
MLSGSAMILRLTQPRRATENRLPRRKTVTAILAFMASDGIVMCADTEQTIGTQHKRMNTKKIGSILGAKFQLVIGGSGDSDWVQMSITQFMDGLTRDSSIIQPGFNWLKLEAAIEQHTATFFRKYIKHYAVDPEKRPTADLLIGVNSVSGRMIYRTTDNIVNRTPSFDSVGSGSILANDLIDRLWRPSLSMLQTASLAIYIMDRVKNGVPGCGGNTDVALLGMKNEFEHLSTNRVKELEIAHADIELRAFEEMVDEIVKHEP